jgi:serine-type D-Ala-D-Ala carboxypeptidase/endopeptidase
MKSPRKLPTSPERLPPFLVSRAKFMQLLLTIASCSICMPSGAAPSSEPGASSLPETRALSGLVLPLAKKANGALVIGFTDGIKHRVFACGLKSETDRRRPDEKTIFEIGSLTKVFTALLLVDLWRDHKLSLDDQVRQFMSSRVNLLPRQAGRITLFQLATHTSGMPRDPDNLQPRTTPYGRGEFHAFLQRCHLESSPGQKYSYSNAGFTLLGEILEIAGNNSYEALLVERVVKPLNLQDTTIVLSRDRLSRLAQGHGKTGQVIASSPLTGGPAGGLKSTAADLLKLLDAALQKPHSKIAADIAGGCQHRVRLNRSESVCPGWFYNADRDSFYKSGQTDGYAACLEFSPARKRGIVVLSSTLELEAEPILNKCAALADK